MSDDNSSNQASSKEVTFTIKLDPMKDPVTGNNNFLLYRKHVTEKLAPRYPLLSDIFEDNVPYELANPTAEELAPPPIQAGIGLEGDGLVYTAAQRREYYLTAMGRHTVKREKFDLDKKTMYKHLWNSLSADAITLVEAHFLYSDHAVAGGNVGDPDIPVRGVKFTKDCNVLWAIIVDTHIIENFGPAGEDMARLAKKKMQNHFEAMVQSPDESVHAFKNRFVDQLTRLDLVGVARPPAADLAITFMDKLDYARHEAMRVTMRNNAAQRIKALPGTFEAVYEIAKVYGTASKPITNHGSGSGAHVFMTSDQLIPVKQSANADISRPRGPNWERNKEKRDTQKAAKAAGSAVSSKPSGTEGDKYPATSRDKLRSSLISKMIGAAKADGSIARSTCLLCNSSEHNLSQCNVLQQSPVDDIDALLKTYNFVVFGACPESDDAFTMPELIDTAVFSETLIAAATTVPETAKTDSVRILFTDNEVILDNAAGDHIFRCDKLLTGIRSAAVPTTMSGVSGAGFTVTKEGDFRDLCTAGWNAASVANIVSQGRLKDAGCAIHYDDDRDEFLVLTPGSKSAWLFVRKLKTDGRTKSPYYTCDMNKADSSVAVLVDTVAENERRYTTTEVKKANAALQFMERLGHISPQGAIDIVNGGVLNSPVTASDVRNAISINGPSLAALKGKTPRKTSSAARPQIVGPRVTQVQQSLDLDIFFVKQLAFLIGVLSPLGLNLCQHIKSRSFECVAHSVRTFISIAASRDFAVKEVRVDGEGALAVMAPDLQALGITTNTSGPGEHVARAERMIRRVKNVVRGFDSTLPYVMTRLLLVFCVLFAASRINLQPSAISRDKISPQEQFSGFKLDAAKDLRAGFGEGVQATVPVTDNTMTARTQGCITLLPTGNSTGSVIMWHMATNRVVTRDQFKIVPLSDHTCQYITSLATKQGYSRGFDPTVGLLDAHEDPAELARDIAAAQAALPEMMAIDGRATEVHPTAEQIIAGSNAGVELQPRQDDIQVPATATDADARPGQSPVMGSNFTETGVRWSARIAGNASEAMPVQFDRADFARAEIRRQLLLVCDWRDTVYALKISVRRAMKDKPEEAREAIVAELKQMLRLKVWHPVRYSDLSAAARKAILRTTMFLKEKFTADGLFEKLKARLVAGGDQQDKELYENLSSPTASTSSVMVVAAIAAAEHRQVMTIDVGGAFLNADIAATGITVHVRLDAVMTRMLVDLAPEYQRYVDDHGTCLVQLDKAMYGCVEAAALWFDNLSAVLVADGFEANPHDFCVFNKIGPDGEQVTLCLHVDDILATSVTQANLDLFRQYLTSVYPTVTHRQGRVVNYVGMTFDFTNEGEVRVTMEHCIKDILHGCGVVRPRSTPAAPDLFEIRDNAEKVSPEDAKYFHTYVAKMLYLSKRVRPECLGAVSFLSTRVQACDVDDLRKLERLLGYLAGTPDRGIVLRVGDRMSVRAYIDAAYGVHTASGKSHSGCVITLGEAGPVFVKSAKQKIVTKSSTESELVCLSDNASQALHLRNFVIAQGYEVGPAILYQDNMSTMALMKRGRPGSERSRHINIRHFWLAERVEGGEAIVEHLSTKDMWANALTKPTQGAQFVKERAGLTNWD